MASHAIAPMKSVEETTKPKQAYLVAVFVPFLKNHNLDCNLQKLRYQPLGQTRQCKERPRLQEGDKIAEFILLLWNHQRCLIRMKVNMISGIKICLVSTLADD